MLELLRKIGASVSYRFDPIELAHEFYAPKGHAVVESEQETIRKSVARFFKGEISLPMAVTDWPEADPEVKARLDRLLTALEQAAVARNAAQPAAAAAAVPAAAPDPWRGVQVKD